MQLKLKRSQRDTGVMSKTVVFCLDARVEFTPEEQEHIQRYKLHKQVIYNSEASQKHLNKAAASVATGNVLGTVKGLGSLAMAAINLNISIESLQRGQHVECKSMEELLGSEEAILTACENLKAYLETAATFDGREMLFDFTSGETQVLATAAPPAAILAAPPPAVAAPTHALAAAAPLTTTFAPEPAPPLPPPEDYEAFERLRQPQANSSTELHARWVEWVRDNLPHGLKDSAAPIAYGSAIFGALFVLWVLAKIF